MAIQIVRQAGGIPIAVVSSAERADHCLRLGAAGVINRRRFQHWGRLPDLNDLAAMELWQRSARSFGQEIWRITGERRSPRIVFEHSGESTVPTSMYVCAQAGMVVICAGTTGYHVDVDLRYLWMRQKRLQGSHFANAEQCRAFNDLIDQGVIDPCLSVTLPLEEVGRAHKMMHKNEHPPGGLDPV